MIGSKREIDSKPSLEEPVVIEGDVSWRPLRRRCPRRLPALRRGGPDYRRSGSATGDGGFHKI